MTSTDDQKRRRRTVLWIVGVGAVLVLIGGFWLALGTSANSALETSPSPTASPSPTMSATPTPTPTPTGFPANNEDYDLAALPTVNVFAVIPALDTDDEPYGAFTGEQARALADAAPVFADPTGEPVAQLAREYKHGGTTVPIVKRQEHWVKVLLTGRSAVPSAGEPGQVVGWLRAQDVAISTNELMVEVSIADRTIDIVSDGKRERVADDFGWGAPDTPTPRGRAFIMTVADSSAAYTRGHKVVYLSVQSPTLDGFGGADVAITAFHYYDARSGAISNGCMRLGPEAIDRLAQLPPGTPVMIRG